MLVLRYGLVDRQVSKHFIMNNTLKQLTDDRQTLKIHYAAFSWKCKVISDDIAVFCRKRGDELPVSFVAFGVTEFANE